MIKHIRLHSKNSSPDQVCQEKSIYKEEVYQLV